MERMKVINTVIRENEGFSKQSCFSRKQINEPHLSLICFLRVLAFIDAFVLFLLSYFNHVFAIEQMLYMTV